MACPATMKISPLLHRRFGRFVGKSRPTKTNLGKRAMSFVGRDGAKADVARKTKRELDGPAAELEIMHRLLKYDQCMRLAMAGYKARKVGVAIGYSKRHVNRILRDMREMQGAMGGRSDAG